MTIFETREKLARELEISAPVLYSAGAARQAIYLAAWLMQAHRTDAEVAKRLKVVQKELLPLPKRSPKKRKRGDK